MPPLPHLQPGDVLTVWRLDRLGRSTPHLVTVVNDLAQRGIGFQSITEAMDTTTAGGELIFHVMAALAQFERRLIAERSRAGIAAARKRGKHLGRPARPADDRQRGTIGFRHGEAARRSPRHAAQGIEEQAW
jgi:DNA invertase Pin-like site-specific DNA recombinase